MARVFPEIGDFDDAGKPTPHLQRATSMERFPADLWRAGHIKEGPAMYIAIPPEARGVAIYQKSERELEIWWVFDDAAEESR